MPHRHAVRPLLGAWAAVLLGVAAVLVPVSPASADEPWPVPGDAVLTVDGRGAGHGHGLSQWGAQGAALDGLTAGEILDFYYPGTGRGTAGGSVEVLITADTSKDVVVGARSGMTLRSLGSGRTWTLPAKVSRKAVKRWRITPASGGRSTISAKTGRWHRWRVIGADAEFAAGGRPLDLHTPSGMVSYRGALRSASPAGSGRDRDTVNVVSLESYLKGVVPSEVYASTWEPAAIRAQSIAARTYAAYERAHAPGGRHYQICDTAHCQVYRGYDIEHPRSNDAVDATAHQVVTSGGEPAFAQFSASNGGWTAQGAFDYLPAREDPYDGPNPYSDWTEQVTAAEIEDAYDIEDLTSIAVETRDGNGEWGGRVETVRLHSSTGWTGTVTGESLRSNVGLSSTWFTISAVDPQ